MADGPHSGLLTRKIAVSLGIDRYVEQSGLSAGLTQANIQRSPTDLIGVLVFWLVFLSAALIALDHLGLSAALVPLQSLIAFFPKILAAILMLIVGAMLAQWIGQAAQAAVASMGVEFHQQLGRAVRFIVLTAVGIIALQQLGTRFKFVHRHLHQPDHYCGCRICVSLCTGRAGNRPEHPSWFLCQRDLFNRG